MCLNAVSLQDLIVFCRFIVWGYMLYGLSFFLLSDKKSLNSFFIILQSKRLTISNGRTLMVLLSAVSFQIAYRTILATFPAYFILISALWVTIYSDLENLLISRFVSLYLAPVGFLLCLQEMLPISPAQSAITALLGGLLLWSINKIFYWFKKHDGLGQGDIDLIICIGAWLGILGTWFTVLAGSILGSLYAACYMLCTRKIIRVIPFGPFLAAAAIIFTITIPYHVTILPALI